MFIRATRLQHYLRCLLAPPGSKVHRKLFFVLWTRMAHGMLTLVRVPEALLHAIPT